MTLARATDDRGLGHVGLYNIDARVGMAEYAIMIGDREYWGRGLGRLCTVFCIEYGFRQLNLNRIYLSVLAGNSRARHLYASIGFREEGTLRQAQYKSGRYLDVVLMALLRDEYGALTQDSPGTAADAAQ
jgi:RimJ/RimL family protein N-acetyltransferase